MNRGAPQLQVAELKLVRGGRRDTYHGSSDLVVRYRACWAAGVLASKFMCFFFIVPVQRNTIASPVALHILRWTVHVHAVGSHAAAGLDRRESSKSAGGGLPHHLQHPSAAPTWCSGTHQAPQAHLVVVRHRRKKDDLNRLKAAGECGGRRQDPHTHKQSILRLYCSLQYGKGSVVGAVLCERVVWHSMQSVVAW